MRYDQTLDIWDFAIGDHKTRVKAPHTQNAVDATADYKGSAEYVTTVDIADGFRGKRSF